MFFNLFKSKKDKALDKIYATYNSLYEKYREYADSDNELLNAQAKILRGQLFQIGAAFDLVIKSTDNQYHETHKCRYVYGYIPFTSKIYTNPNWEYKIGYNAKFNKLRRLNDRLKNKPCLGTGISRKLHAVYLKEYTTELYSHVELIEETKSLGIIPCYDNIRVVDYLPKF